MDYVCSFKIEDRRLYEGKEYIDNMPRLYVAIVEQDCREIIIEPDFAEANFTPPFGLSQFIEDVNRINPRLRIIAPQGLVKTYEEDIDLLKAFQDPEDVLLFAMKNKDKYMKLLKMLCNQYSEKHIESLIANNKLASMHLLLQDSNNKRVQNEERAEELEKKLYEERHRVDTISARIKYTHDVDMNKEFLDGIKLENANYSKILYIKEITRVHYLDTMIYYLQEILKVLYDVPARLVVIESIDAYSTAYQYPHCKPHLSLTKKDVAYGDIFMAGFQQSIMRDVLLNTGRVPYLIILDRSKWREPYVKGDKVEVVHTVSDLEDLDFEAVAERVISYDDQTHCIPHIENFEGMETKQKMMHYSSMEVVKYLVDLIEKDE